MNKSKKGQVTVGVVVIVAIIAIVGAIFVQLIAQEVGQSTSTVPLVNESFAADAAASVPQYLTTWRAIDSIVIYNETSEGIGVIPAANYTATNNVIDPTTGGLSVRITPSADITEAIGSLWQVSGTAQTTTYIDSSGARAMASLIVIMFALSLVVVVLGPTVNSKLLEALGK